MRFAPRALVAAAGLMLGGSGCNLFDVQDREADRGRGPQAHDPYEGSRSGTIRLSLQMFKGCAVLATGEPVAPGTAAIPGYPDACPFLHTPDYSPVPPSGTIPLVIGTDYFLHQLTLMDAVVNQHTDYQNPQPALAWMANESMFRDLDWSNVGVSLDEWRPIDPHTGIWIREVFFDNATWMVQDDDVFTVEVLDSAGNPVAGPERPYTRNDFLSENATSGHSRVSWRVEGLAPPAFPGDTTIRNPPEFPPTFRTNVRIDLNTSLDPFNSFEVPNVEGDGSIRVTWNKLPEQPFYFPVRFVRPESVPPSCFNEDGSPAPCGFGLDPQIQLSAPANGEFYEPGEPFVLQLRVKDSEGHLLHSPNEFPSWNEFLFGQSNGLLYDGPKFTYLEEDYRSAYKIIGPLQNLTAQSDVSKILPENVWQYPRQSADGDETMGVLVPALAGNSGVPGMADARWPTQEPILIAENAQPGTYVALLKTHRYFLGERTARTDTVYFQIGTAEKTSYPGHVGNCQICHRGVVSLENVRHGMSGDDVESCKGCHSGVRSSFSRNIHAIHMRSDRYPMPRNDCTACHLVRESAIRPSLDVCASCHTDSVHGSEYFSVEFSTLGEPNRYGNCAVACHGGNQAPSAHILPPE